VRALGLVREIVDRAGGFFQTTGYGIVPLAVFLETFALIGIAVPGDVILALGGVYAARGDLELAIVLPLGIAAAWGGSAAGFWLGNRHGRRVVRALPFSDRLERHIDRTRHFFRRHGGKAVVLGRFATGVAAFVPFVAGMSEMPARRFVAFMVPTVAIWATAIIMLGYVLGRNLDAVDTVLSRFGWIGLAIAVAALAGGWIWNRVRGGA
jgi:membrane-associated protein